MSSWNSAGGRMPTARSFLLGARSLTDAVTGVAAVSVFTIIWLVPPPLLVPAFSLFALVGAAVIGTYAWCVGAERRGNRVTSWDVSGACAFVGIAAGMLSEPEHVVQLFGLATSAQ